MAHYTMKKAIQEKIKIPPITYEYIKGAESKKIIIVYFPLTERE